MSFGDGARDGQQPSSFDPERNRGKSRDIGRETCSTLAPACSVPANLQESVHSPAIDSLERILIKLKFFEIDRVVDNNSIRMCVGRR